MISILDIGSGNEIRFQDPKYKIVHVDLNPDSWHLEFIADGYNLPFNRKSFDIVFCSHVLEHLINPKQFIQELIRVAKKGIIFRIPNSKYYRNFTSSKSHIFGWSSYNFYYFLKPHFRKVNVYTSFRIPRKKGSRIKRKVSTLKIIFLSLFFEKNEITGICII
jgi:ubiquinone/menaquinone biosynthesis C-methylase UbiE